MTRTNVWRSPAFSAALLFSSLICASAYGADCGPLKEVAAIDLTVARNGVATLPVTINGSPRKLIFDTAGGRSVLSQTAVDSLGLHPLSVNSRLLSRSGNASDRTVALDSFIIGGLEAKHIVFMVSPNPNMGTNPNAPVDGWLAGDVMENYDADLDFAGSKLTYFSPDHCDGHVVYWTSTPAASIDFRRGRPGAFGGADTHVRFHITLDGKDLLAVLATGAVRTQISARVADADFNVTADTPNTVPLGEMAGKKVFGYVFKTITFGNVTVTNPHVAVLPDVVGRNDPNNRFRTDSHVVRVDDNLEPDITIGMDVLRQLHVYIAAKEEKLYLTAADVPKAAAP
jgi:hypothetical protein